MGIPKVMAPLFISRLRGERNSPPSSSPLKENSINLKRPQKVRDETCNGLLTYLPFLVGKGGNTEIGRLPGGLLNLACSHLLTGVGDASSATSQESKTETRQSFAEEIVPLFTDRYSIIESWHLLLVGDLAKGQQRISLLTFDHEQ